MNKHINKKTLPTHVSEVDALKMENLALKLGQAQAQAQALAAEANREIAALAERYRFDPAKGEGFDYATRKITRVDAKPAAPPKASSAS